MAESSFETAFQLAIEESKRTYREEENRRATNVDLINLESESLDEKQRRLRNERITQLYQQTPSRTLDRHPASYGWNIPQSPQMIFPPSPHFGHLALLSTSSPVTAFPPPLIPPRTASMQNSSSDPFLMAGWSRPESAYEERNCETTTNVRRMAEPSRANRSALIYSSSSCQSNDILSSSEMDDTCSSTENAPAYVNQLVIPYMVNNNGRGCDCGDLIDLKDPINDEARQELLWREFDPLYRTDAVVEKEWQVAPLAAPSDADVCPPAPSIVVRKVAERKPPARRPPDPDYDMSVIQFAPYTPGILQQIENIRLQLPANLPQMMSFMTTVADYHTTDVNCVKTVVTKDHTWPPSDNSSITMTCDTTQTVDFILFEVLASFLSEEEMKHGVSESQYGLKVYGLEEFLHNKSVFGRNVYVGKCLLLGKDIRLQVGRRPTESEMVPSCGDASELTKSIRISSAINADDIMTVLGHLEPAMHTFKAALHEKAQQKQGDLPKTINPQRSQVKQIIKMLCQYCGAVEPSSLTQRLHSYLSEELIEKRPHVHNDLILAIHNLISTYCISSMSTACPVPIRPQHETTQDVTDSMHELQCVVNGVHNVPDDWAGITDYALSIFTYYGTKRLESHSRTTIRKTADSPLGFIPMSLCAPFEKCVCLTQRETRIVIVLHGIRRDRPQNSSQQEAAEALAYAVIPLFDHNNLLRQGEFFVPMRRIISDSVVHPWGAMPVLTRGAPKSELLLSVTLPKLGVNIRFPEVSVEEGYVSSRQSAVFELCEAPLSEQELLLDLIEAGSTECMSTDECELLWQRRFFLVHIPEALPLVLASVEDWAIAFLPSVYEVLNLWAPLPPITAMQLLLPQFPDSRVRAKAVEWISAAATENSDFIFTALPQLVEVLRFEQFENSAVAKFLLELTFKDGKFAYEIFWQLQQRIDHCNESETMYALRCSLLQTEILNGHRGSSFVDDIFAQRQLLQSLDDLQRALRENNADDKMVTMRHHLGLLDGQLLARNVPLPILPSFKCTGINIQACGIFNSNAKPLKITFRGINEQYSIIHKSGDDMRQDAIVLQLVSVMNDIWKDANLDLRMIIFKVMACGLRKGMGELVGDCSTLRDIQRKHGGLAGVFQDDILNKYLISNNSSEFSFKQALDNFKRSCAGWCVATYVLGIGDRHNDNILVTTKGHVFHIDFGKYMGDWQMAGGFKRDRVPFVFTPDMYYVVNQGPKQSENYQIFIDYCTKAFNCLRAKSSHILTLLKIMACSGIPGMTLESVSFVETNLLLNISETDAVIQFTHLLQNSLESAFPRLNFALHTVAQIFSRGYGSNQWNVNELSFVDAVYSEITDGRIETVKVLGIEKYTSPSKIYMYKMEIRRVNVQVNSIICRSFKEFSEFYIKMQQKFPGVKFPVFKWSANVRSNVFEVAKQRMVDITTFLEFLFNLRAEVCHCDLLYTFFHSTLRDNTGTDDLELSALRLSGEDSPGGNDVRSCQLRLKLCYSQNKAQLSVFVGHAKNLQTNNAGQPPDSYIKTYLRPDKQKSTKRKTPIVKTSANPTFNAELLYEHIEHVSLLEVRLLEISIWYSSTLDNTRHYQLYFPLKKLAIQQEDRKGCRRIDDWFELIRC